MTASQVEILDGIVEEFWEKLSQEGASYRKRVIIPFCDNYKLAFGSAMGYFYFYDRQWQESVNVLGQNNSNVGEWFEDHFRLGKRSRLTKDLSFVSQAKEIVDVLNHEIDQSNVFGYMIQDYLGFKLRIRART